MGQMRFLVTRRDGPLTQLLADHSYVLGSDGFPFRCRVAWEGSELVIDRWESESGSFCTAWAIPHRGVLMLKTTSLREREEPYLLELELARGTVSRAKQAVAHLDLAGVALPPVVPRQLRDASGHFYRASLEGEIAAKVDHALASLAMALAVLNEAASALADAFQCRPHALRGDGFFWGCRFPDGVERSNFEVLRDQTNSVLLSQNWADVEPRPGELQWEAFDERVDWCEQRGWMIVVGPIIDFAPAKLPPWLWQPPSGGALLREAFVRWTEAVVDRYRGRAVAWKVADRVLDEYELPFLGGDIRLHLAAECLDAARRADPTAGRLISFEDPWGEYAARRDVRCSPLQYADALIRSNVGATAIDLHLRMAENGGAQLPRDAMEIVDRLDLWGRLGLPLWITLALPSGGEADSSTRSKQKGAPTLANQPSEREGATFEIIRLLMSHPFVIGMHWEQLRDRDPPCLEAGGLLDAAGNPKPILSHITSWFHHRLGRKGNSE